MQQQPFGFEYAETGTKWLAYCEVTINYNQDNLDTWEYVVVGPNNDEHYGYGFNDHSNCVDAAVIMAKDLIEAHDEACGYDEELAWGPVRS